MTAYADRFLTCSSCGVQFLFTAAEQRDLAQIRSEVRAPDLCPGCAALNLLTRRRRGTVKWYDAHKGYGFIRDEDGGDVFVHRSALGREGHATLRLGQTVEFDLEHTERGSTARDVVVLP